MEEKIIQEQPKEPKLPQKLEQQFRTLEEEWQSFTQSSMKTKPKKKFHKQNTSDCSSVHRQMILLESSPRDLMSSLQHPTMLRGTSSPPFSTPRTIIASGQVWRVRENELAQEEEERGRERRIGIENGKLKGRRLFEEEDEVGFGGDDEIKCICTEVCEYGSCYGKRNAGDEKQGMLCFGTEEGEDEEREREGVVVKEINEERKVGVSCVFVKVCFAIILLAFVLGIIGGIGDGFKEGGNILLIPT